MVGKSLLINTTDKLKRVSVTDPEIADANIVRERIDNARIETALSNSFGFGGTNATLVFQRHN